MPTVHICSHLNAYCSTLVSCTCNIGTELRRCWSAYILAVTVRHKSNYKIVYEGNSIVLLCLGRHVYLRSSSPVIVPRPCKVHIFC